jgi:hypothetical protein
VWLLLSKLSLAFFADLQMHWLSLLGTLTYCMFVVYIAVIIYSILVHSQCTGINQQVI